jgi:hypothetical protein
MADEEAGTSSSRSAETPPADAGTNVPRPIQDPSNPTKFFRPAPTFHAGETKTTRVKASLEAVVFPGVSAGVSWETTTTVRETRCVRCRKAESSHGSSSVPKSAAGYLVMGIVSAVDRQPVERIVFLRETDFKNLFWKMRLATIRLRGPRYFFSLKSVKAFRLYRCVTSTGAHKQLELDTSALSDLKQFRAAYKKRPWPPAVVNEGWSRWVVDCLDGGSMDIMNEDAYSLEIVLGWSPSRISIAVLSPVALSLVIGFWFNSRDWTDLATIQTAWGLASYIATAGGCKW